MSADRHGDVVIVGARAAGAATALLPARLGQDVVLDDRAVLPVGTVSTHQIARTGVVQLHRWGLLDGVLDNGAPAIRRVTFSTATESITRQIGHKAGLDLLVAPRRYVLDTILARAAADAGAEPRLGATITRVHRDDSGRVVGVFGHDRAGGPAEIRARYVLGAGGLASRVARWVGAPAVADHGDRGAAQYPYYGGIGWSGIELTAAERALAGVATSSTSRARWRVTRPSRSSWNSSGASPMPSMWRPPPRPPARFPGQRAFAAR